jgi:hypothetical protein
MRKLLASVAFVSLVASSAANASDIYWGAGTSRCSDLIERVPHDVEDQQALTLLSLQPDGDGAMIWGYFNWITGYVSSSYSRVEKLTGKKVREDLTGVDILNSVLKYCRQAPGNTVQVATLMAEFKDIVVKGNN